jgi:hypothetical protein
MCGTQDEEVSSVVHAPISCLTLESISVRMIRRACHIFEAASHLVVFIKPDLVMLLAGGVFIK